MMKCEINGMQNPSSREVAFALIVVLSYAGIRKLERNSNYERSFRLKKWLNTIVRID